MTFTVSKLNVRPSISVVEPALPGYRQSVWTWVVGPWREGPQVELYSISARSLTIKLDEPDEASFTLLGDSPDALEVHELISDLWVYRDGHPMYRGRAGMTSGDDIDTTSYSVPFSSTSYAGMLNRRFIWSTDTRVLAGVATPIYGLISPSLKAQDVLWHIADHVQGQPGMNLGITKGAWPDLPDTQLTAADAFFNNGDYALPHMQTIAKSMKFDWWIDVDRRLNVAAQRGRVSEEPLDYPGRLTKVSRSFNSDAYANFIHQTGGGTDPIANAKYFPPAGLTDIRPEGGWATAIGAPSINADFDPKTDPVALAKLLGLIQTVGQANYDKLSKLLPVDDSPGNFTYTVTLALGVWRGPEHIWVGDTVRMVVKRGRLDINELMRVQQIQISIDQNDTETITMVLGWPKNAKDTIRNFAASVAYLNRR